MGLALIMGQNTVRAIPESSIEASPVVGVSGGRSAKRACAIDRAQERSSTDEPPRGMASASSMTTRPTGSRWT